MSQREQIKTTIQQAVDYWIKYIDECDLSVDWAEANTHCWRCGCEKHLERCHIIPHALGGEDKPENIVLLCKRCHAEGPNVADPSIMWDWIKAYNVPFYETFWDIEGRKEYEFIYKRSVTEDLKRIFNKANITETNAIVEKLRAVKKEVMEKASIHFGQPYFNTATIAGLYRMIIKQLASDLNVDINECLELSESDRKAINIVDALYTGYNKNNR
ncbi:MAG: HNH endonuclease [Anaeroplasmataceae bacterium]|nr:HNH endonuclease [Anaeroplasmataceae bacterium]